MNDGFIVAQRLSTPIRRDEGKEAVFNLVPFAGAGWKMTDRKRNARFIRKLLQLEFPKPQSPAITPPTVGSDQNRSRIRRESSTFMAPPSPNGRNGKRSSVMIGSDIDKTGVAANVVNAIWISTRNLGPWKVVTANLNGVFCRKPLLASVVVIADEFFLLGIYRNHRTSLGQACFHCGIDVPKLRVAVRMASPLLGLPIALQTIVEIVKNLSHLCMADRVFLPDEFFGNCSRAFANPPQRRFRIATRLVIDHLLQFFHQLRVRNSNELASGSRPADAPFQWRRTLFDFTDTF